MQIYAVILWSTRGRTRCLLTKRKIYGWGGSIGRVSSSDTGPTAICEEGDSHGMRRAALSQSEISDGPVTRHQVYFRPMNIEDKLHVIEEILGFLLDALFMETASDFSSPEGVIEDWHLTAIAFRSVRDKHKIPKESSLPLTAGNCTATPSGRERSAS